MDFTDVPMLACPFLGEIARDPQGARSERGGTKPNPISDVRPHEAKSDS